MTQSETLTHRIRTDKYGSGSEIQVYAYTQRVDRDHLAEWDMNLAEPWTIFLGGNFITYGAGSAVLSQNPVGWDCDQDWGNHMSAIEPTEADCLAVAQEALDLYLTSARTALSR